MTDPVPSPSQPHLRTADLQRSCEQFVALMGEAAKSLENPHQPHLITIADDGEINVKSYGNIAELVSVLKSLHGTDTYGIPFVGYPLAITPGEQHFLILANGERVPLFDEMATDAESPAWHLGVVPNPAAAEPPPPADAGEFDDFEDGAIEGDEDDGDGEWADEDDVIDAEASLNIEDDIEDDIEDASDESDAVDDPPPHPE
jgi:hypothetical protein